MENLKKSKIKIITNLIGDGKSIESDISVKEIPSRDLEPSVFVDTHIEKFVEHGERSFKYMDCVKESFVIGGEKNYVFYVRYRLDAEKENFKDFVSGLKPADFLKNSM